MSKQLTAQAPVDPIVLGKMGSSYGIRGWLRVFSVLVIKANLKDAFGIKERLVPFLDGQVIKKVDLTTRSIEVDWDPGF